MFSFLHTHDAATAIVAALDKPVAGPLNVVDDNPTHARHWIPELARIIGAAPPKHVPVTLARLAVGFVGRGVHESARRRRQQPGALHARLAPALRELARRVPGRTGIASDAQPGGVVR